MLPDQYFLAIPALFASLFLGMIPTDLLCRLLLKEKYSEFTLYGNLSYGFDTWGLTKLLAIMVLVPSVTFSVLELDCYARFTDNQIITNRFWGFGETAHNYNQITRIKSVRYRKAPKGVTEYPYHVIHFSDGSIWSTRNNFYRADREPELSNEQEKEILAFVAEKCGKEIERYDLLNKDEDR